MENPLKLAFINVIGALNPQYDPYDYLHRCLEVMDESLMYAEMFQRQPDDFERWHHTEARLWAGQSVKRAREGLAELPWLPGAREVAALLHEHGVKLALISRGFDVQLKPIAEDLHADFTFANTLCTEAGRLTGEIVIHHRDEERGDLVTQTMAEVGASKDECIALGATVIDIPMFERVGWSVAIKPPHDRVREAASLVLEDPDLTPLLPLLAQRLGK